MSNTATRQTRARAIAAPAPNRETLRLSGLVLLGLIVLAALALIGQPSLAQSKIVFGSDNATACYREARFGTGFMAGLRACDAALAEETLARRDRLATRINRGVLLNRAKRYDEALAEFNAVIEAQPNIGEAYLNRGNTHFFRRAFDSAETDYSKAIELETRDLHAAYYNRGLVREAQARVAEALSDYRASLAAKPDFLPAAARLDQIGAASAE